MKKVLMWLSILTAVALVVLNLVYPFGPDPDVVCPMTNRNITWYYANKNP